MEKTYKILENPVQMSGEEIRRQYKGYWVYVVNAERLETGKLISGIPVIVGKMAFDGAEDGIYEKYRGDEYAPRSGVTMLSRNGFISSLRFVDEA